MCCSVTGKPSRLWVRFSFCHVDFCCPAYLTVAHEWLCRQGAHTHTHTRTHVDGEYPLGGILTQWVINPPSGKIIRDCFNAVDQEVVVRWGEQTWLHILLSHPSPSPPPLDVSVLQSAGITQWSLSQWLRCISSQTQDPPKVWRRSSTGPKHIDITDSAFVCLSFVSTSLAQKTHGHIFQSAPLFFPRLDSVKTDWGCRLRTNVLASLLVTFVLE